MLLGVLLQQLSTGPFNGQKVQPSIGLPDFYGTHHVGVLYSSTVLSFANETRDCGTIVPQFLAENLEGNCAMARMLSLVHSGRTALSDLTLYGIPGYL